MIDKGKQPNFQHGQKYRISSRLLLKIKTNEGVEKWFNSNDIIIWDSSYNFVNLYMTIASGTICNNEIVKPQLELGLIPTEYTPYLNDLSGVSVSRIGDNEGTQTVKADADGTVKGLSSVSPNMILRSDAIGVNIECTYYIDTKKYIDNKLFTTTAQISSVTLAASKWVGTASPYSQVVTIPGATKNSKIDINPTVGQLSEFHDKDISFVVGNNNGTITVYCIGQKPTKEYTMQVTITEVANNG